MPAHARRSVTDIILYIYPSREPIVRNHEPRAKALGNYIYIYIYIYYQEFITPAGRGVYNGGYDCTNSEIYIRVGVVD